MDAAGTKPLGSPLGGPGGRSGGEGGGVGGTGGQDVRLAASSYSSAHS